MKCSALSYCLSLLDPWLYIINHVRNRTMAGTAQHTNRFNFYPVRPPSTLGNIPLRQKAMGLVPCSPILGAKTGLPNGSKHASHGPVRREDLGGDPLKCGQPKLHPEILDFFWQGMTLRMGCMEKKALVMDICFYDILP